MKKYALLFIALCYSFISGCNKNPLAPAGTIGFAGENKTQSFASPHLRKGIAKGIGPEIHSPIELTCAIEKIEITTTGEKWIEVFKGNAELKITDSDTTVKTIVSATPADNDEYHGVRIWFGDKIKAKGTVEIYDGIYATDKREIWEKERSGIASLNPFTFTTANFNFDAFDIERGKETFIIFRFPIN